MTDPPKKSDALHFASLVAHQLRAPVAAVQSMVRTLLGGYIGELTDRQREMLLRADARCTQAMESVRRMLAISHAASGTAAEERCDLAEVLRETFRRYEPEASRRSVTLTAELAVSTAPVRAAEEALIEAISALLDNALKYTPAQGRVGLSLAADGPRGGVTVCVDDSGGGIPEADREKVFEPFHRSASAKASARPGTGLGLAFVRAVVEAAGGSVWADKAPLGGARLVLNLPLLVTAAAEQGAGPMSRSLKVVIVGGVAAGPKVASKIIRLNPEAEVTVVEKNRFLSYAGCGLPYYVSGVVKEQKELMSTPVGMMRDPVFFHEVKNVRVLNQTEALRIDRAEKRLLVKDLAGGAQRWLAYDKLVLTTGASPIRPPIPGADAAGVFSFHGVQDAEGIRAALAEGRARDVVIVGGGLIGVETTEALAAHGCRVTIVELLPQILRILDDDMALLVERHMEAKGVKVLTNTRVESFEVDAAGHVRAVVTEKARLPADMVIMGIGVRPNGKLAREAGLRIGPTKAIEVDDHMRTSDPDIYAAGDCVQCTNLITGRPTYAPLGSTANKQGRVAAINLCGGDDDFPGIVGSTVCKVFDYCVGRTGLTAAQAREAGFEPVCALAPAPDKAHYMPDARMLLLKLVVDRTTRRLLGAQVAGGGAGDKRIDVAAMAVTAGMTVDQLAKADLCYAPPYAPAMDNIITACNVARNKLDGVMRGITAAEVHRWIQESRDFFFLDARSVGEHEAVRLPNATLIPLGALRGRLDEVPRDKPVVAFCEVSLRGYEAALILRAAGYTDVRVLDGGVAMWPYKKIA